MFHSVLLPTCFAHCVWLPVCMGPCVFCTPRVRIPVFFTMCVAPCVLYLVRGSLCFACPVFGSLRVWFLECFVHLVFFTLCFACPVFGSLCFYFKFFALYNPHSGLPADWGSYERFIFQDSLIARMVILRPCHLWYPPTYLNLTQGKL